MKAQRKRSFSLRHFFMAIAIVLGSIVLIFLAVFVVDWQPTPLLADRLDKSVNSEKFKSQIKEAVNSKNLKACEEAFSEELVTLACLLEATPRAWFVYYDPSLCDEVSQTALSQPIGFAGDFLFDNHSACIIFLSIGAEQDFCDKATNPLSEASCQHIVQRSLGA